MDQISSKSRLDLKFELLTDGQRRIVHIIAQGKTDEELAKDSHVDLGAFCGKVMDIMRALSCGGIDYKTKRADLVRLGREFYNMGTVSATPEPVSLPPPTEVLLDTQEEEPEERTLPASAAEADTESEDNKTASRSFTADAPTLPDLETLKKRILKLTPKDRERFEAGASAVYGEMNKAAQKVGLSGHTLQQLMVPLYKRLGLPRVTGRKELAAQAIRELKRDEIAQRTHTQTSPVASEAEPIPPFLRSQPQPAETRPQISPQTEAPARVPALSQEAPVPSGSFGAGVVIPLPPDTVGVEVLSGEFTRDNPSADLSEEMARRKHAGIAPSMLVLYPSAVDPTKTQGHVIFIRKEPK